MNKKKRLIRMARRREAAKKTNNEQVYKKEIMWAGQHRCPICGPWSGENTVRRTPRRGAKKPKHKNKRG